MLTGSEASATISWVAAAASGRRYRGVPFSSRTCGLRREFLTTESAVLALPVNVVSLIAMERQRDVIGSAPHLSSSTSSSDFAAKDRG